MKLYPAVEVFIVTNTTQMIIYVNCNSIGTVNDINSSDNNNYDNNDDDEIITLLAGMMMTIMRAPIGLFSKPMKIVRSR